MSKYTNSYVGSSVGKYFLMTTLACFFVFPVLWMVVSSFKPEAMIFLDIRSIKAFLPPLGLSLKEWITPYLEVTRRFNLFRSMSVSFIYAGSVVMGSILVNSMAGYALARIRFRGKSFWLHVIILLIIVPVETTIIPLFVVVNSLRLVNTLLGLFIPLLGSAFNVFLFRQFFLGIPLELEEAAIIDGANRYRIFFSIVVPLSTPVFATVAIFGFIGTWNDFLWPVLMLTDSSLYPLQVALNVLYNTEPVYTNQVMAALTISTIPIILLFLFFQKYIVQGISFEGIKG